MQLKRAASADIQRAFGAVVVVVADVAVFVVAVFSLTHTLSPIHFLLF